jgi:hypothetical protein
MRIGDLKLLALLFAFGAAQADDCVERDLGRMRVTELPSGEYTDTAIIGETFGADFYGTVIICGSPIRTLEYSANLITYEEDHIIRHELYDFADALSHKGNGAEYRVRSRLPGVGEYNVVFFRRAPESADYDPSTIFRVTTFMEDIVVVTPTSGSVGGDADIGPGPGPVEDTVAERDVVRRAMIYELDYRALQ